MDNIFDNIYKLIVDGAFWPNQVTEKDIHDLYESKQLIPELKDKMRSHNDDELQIILDLIDSMYIPEENDMDEDDIESQNFLQRVKTNPDKYAFDFLKEFTQWKKNHITGNIPFDNQFIIDQYIIYQDYNFDVAMKQHVLSDINRYVRDTNNNNMRSNMEEIIHLYTIKDVWITAEEKKLFHQKVMEKYAGKYIIQNYKLLKI
jgi:predicted house-cleaning noncanonical NTP pyrophosphatase (MazG superfamily)